MVGCNTWFILGQINRRNNDKKPYMYHERCRMLTINLLQLVAKVIANFTMFRFFFVCGEKWDNFFIT